MRQRTSRREFDSLRTGQEKDDKANNEFSLAVYKDEYYDILTTEEALTKEESPSGVKAT